MAQLKIYELNSKKYKDIKRMDRSQTKEYLKDVYEAGMAAGQQPSGDSFDMNLCMAAVSEIKGIGPEKLKQIRLAMIAAGAKENQDISNNTGCDVKQQIEHISKQQEGWNMEHNINDELQRAWDDAYSMRPGELPDGDYRGYITKGNTVYHFYKSRKKNEYRYISEKIR